MSMHQRRGDQHPGGVALDLSLLPRGLPFIAGLFRLLDVVVNFLRGVVGFFLGRIGGLVWLAETGADEKGQAHERNGNQSLQQGKPSKKARVSAAARSLVTAPAKDGGMQPWAAPRKSAQTMSRGEEMEPVLRTKNATGMPIDFGDGNSS